MQGVEYFKNLIKYSKNNTKNVLAMWLTQAFCLGETKGGQNNSKEWFCALDRNKLVFTQPIGLFLTLWLRFTLLLFVEKLNVLFVSPTKNSLRIEIASNYLKEIY